MAEVYFPQVHRPGDLLAHDFVVMNSLRVTIAGRPFEHLLFHAVLTYSNWDHVHLCNSEWFEALSRRLQDALHRAGGVPRRIRSDSLTAAVNNLSSNREFAPQYRCWLSVVPVQRRHHHAADPPPGRRTAKPGVSRCIHAADGNQLSQARDGNAKLRDQLARVQQQNQRLQDEHRQSILSVRTLERELVSLKADLVQERETVARLTRESQAPVSPARDSRVAHVDQTPRPMAPYGYWASPSGYRYGGRW